MQHQYEDEDPFYNPQLSVNPYQNSNTTNPNDPSSIFVNQNSLNIEQSRFVKTNKFDAKGRTAKENEAFNYIKTLANYRKKTSALQNGKTMQYVPEEGIYVYFRYDDQKTVMVIYNGNDEAKKLKLERFKERTSGFSGAKEITNGMILKDFGSLDLLAKTTLVFELSK
jgi:glycosidase